MLYVLPFSVVICWKIRIFAYWTTPCCQWTWTSCLLWFAEKFVSLLIEQHPAFKRTSDSTCCDLLKNSYLCLLNNTQVNVITRNRMLWFAEKFVSLLIEQHHEWSQQSSGSSCDLLKNSYLCLLNNTTTRKPTRAIPVVICWKIRIFAYWTTPGVVKLNLHVSLWFAEKFVSLLIEQHLSVEEITSVQGCDLLKNSYLCLLNNTTAWTLFWQSTVVICWKIRIFAYWTTPKRTYTPSIYLLWFAEKFVSLLIEQHLRTPCSWQS